MLINEETYHKEQLAWNLNENTIFFFEWNSLQSVNLNVGQFFVRCQGIWSQFSSNFEILPELIMKRLISFPLHKMATISQTIYSPALYVNKKIVFWLKKINSPLSHPMLTRLWRIYEALVGWVDAHSVKDCI